MSYIESLDDADALREARRRRAALADEINERIRSKQGWQARYGQDWIRLYRVGASWALDMSSAGAMVHAGGNYARADVRFEAEHGMPPRPCVCILLAQRPFSTDPPIYAKAVIWQEAIDGIPVRTAEAPAGAGGCGRATA